MPTEKQYASLGVKATCYGVPITIEEFDTNAKRQGACLDEAISNVIYRSFLADFRNSFCEKVEEITQIPRKTKKVKRGEREVEVWDETEGDYIKGVRLAKGWEDDDTQLQKIADEVCKNDALKFDASATERKPAGPKKLPEGFKSAATRIFTNGNEAAWASKLGLSFSGDRDKDIELLGWAIKKVEDDKRKARVETEYV